MNAEHDGQSELNSTGGALSGVRVLDLSRVLAGPLCTQILADLGISEFDLETLIDNLDIGSDQMLTEVAHKINIGPEFQRVVETSFGD